MVDEGFLTEDQLLDALAEQNRSGTPLGKVLVDLGFVSPGAVANALAEQHGGLLRTEYGTSAGLREMAGRAPIRTDAPPQPALPLPAPAPVPAAPQATQAAPLGSGLRLAGSAPDAPETPEAPEAEAPTPVEPPAPEPVQPEPTQQPETVPAPESAARIEELESQLHAVLTERNSLVQSFNELQARLNEAAKAHEAGVSAEVEQRVGAMASQLQAAAANREELERAQQQATERIAELERHLADTAGGRHELEAELEQLRARDNGDATAQLEELAQLRDAAEARTQALEHELAQLRAQTESETARAEALAAEVAELREHASGQDEGLAAHVAGLEESLRTTTAERDAAVTRAAELEPELASLREQIRAAGTPAEGSAADVADLRHQLAARERRLAESVGEIAKLHREHRALLQLVERQLQLEETTTSVPEPKSEAAHVLFVPAATGYTLVERDGVAPEAGDIVELDGARYVVRRHGPSPLPGPRRRCAYLERA